MLKRREFCRLAAIAGATLAAGHSGLVRAAATAYGTLGQPLTEVAQLDWLCNAVALTNADNRLFAGLPRWPGNEKTPSIGEIMPDGSLKPFPGGAWNTWAPGQPGAHALVKINTIHIFDDDTLWAVDQGSSECSDGNGKKVLQFDTRTGKVLRNITFGPDILPPGADLNDLRLDAGHAYFTDSGAGAIVVLDLKTGKAIRRLAGHPSTKAHPERRPMGEGGTALMAADGSDLVVNSDPIELSPDGRWLYYQPLTGPLWKVDTVALRDPKISEQELAKYVHFVYDTPPLTGTAIDSAGNLYFAEMDRPRITVLSPDGALRVLAEDVLLWNPDAMIISNRRELYVPIPQSGRLASNRGPGASSMIEAPYKIFKMPLPDYLGQRETVPAVAR